MDTLPILSKVKAAAMGGGVASTAFLWLLLQTMGVPEDYSRLLVMILVAYGPAIVAVATAYAKRDPFLSELLETAQNAMKEQDSQ